MTTSEVIIVNLGRRPFAKLSFFSFCLMFLASVRLLRPKSHNASCRGRNDHGGGNKIQVCFLFLDVFFISCFYFLSAFHYRISVGGGFADLNYFYCIERELGITAGVFKGGTANHNKVKERK